MDTFFFQFTVDFDTYSLQLCSLTIFTWHWIWTHAVAARRMSKGKQILKARFEL